MQKDFYLLEDPFHNSDPSSSYYSNFSKFSAQFYKAASWTEKLTTDKPKQLKC